jgi:hypothetical protein
MAVVPAAPGWTLKAGQFGASLPFTTPIAAWVLSDHGDFWPVAGIPESSVEDLNPNGEIFLRIAGSSRYRIVPPAQS